MSSTAKKSMTIICAIVFVIFLPFIIWLLYYGLVLKNSMAIQTGYVDAMAYNGEEQKFFIEAEYFPNEFGVKLNYYTDTKVPNKNDDGSYGKKYTYSTGVQFGGAVTYSMDKTLGWWAESYKCRLKNATYYNSTDSGVTYEAISEFSDRNSWVYDIQGDLVLIKERGYSWHKGTLGWNIGTCYDTNMMITDIYKSIKSLEDGEHIVTFDLSKYYTFTLYNAETGMFDAQIEDSNVLKKYIFINIKVSKSSNDFVSANQSSLFGQYKGDANWTKYDFEKLDYWRARNEYNFKISDFTFVYENEGYYLKLQSVLINYLSPFTNMKYIVTIDLDNIFLASEKLEIKGFSKNCFGSLGIDEVNLTSTANRTFEVYNNYNINCTNNINVVLVGGAK